MQILDLTLLVKTFVRPMCLENLLKSIEDYQNYWKLKFADIVIIDDSDEENKNFNKEIIKKYVNLNISYYEYEFNSLGLSKGRNEGLNKTKTEYFVLCDDDFIFDINCDLQNNLKTVIDNNLDILSGYYRNIKTIESESYKKQNWIGFIQENDEFDICNIYENLFPEFLKCDIVQNFYIGKTDAIKRVGYPEDLPLGEHNIFFLRAKHENLNVVSSSKLYVKHLHLKNKNFDYSKFRNRTLVNPINKPVVGTLTTEDCIYKFDNYILVAGKKFIDADENKKYRFKLNLLICKIDVYMSLFKTIDKLLKKK